MIKLQSKKDVFNFLKAINLAHYASKLNFLQIFYTEIKNQTAIG